MQKVLAAVAIRVDPELDAYFEDYIVIDCEREDIEKIDAGIRARLDDIQNDTPVEEVLGDVMSQLGVPWRFFTQDSTSDVAFDAVTIFSM